MLHLQTVRRKRVEVADEMAMAADEMFVNLFEWFPDVEAGFKESRLWKALQEYKLEVEGEAQNIHSV